MTKVWQGHLFVAKQNVSKIKSTTLTKLMQGILKSNKKIIKNKWSSSVANLCAKVVNVR